MLTRSSKEEAREAEPGQSKSLGTDAFIAFGSEPSREVRRGIKWNCDKGVRSRQKISLR